MKKVFIAIAIFLFACNNKNNNSPITSLPLNHNTIQMKVGDSWPYKELLINFGRVAVSPDIPDTLIGYSFLSATNIR